MTAGVERQPGHDPPSAPSSPSRDELIVQNLGLVTRLARRFASRGQDLDDLVQVGCIGLIRAIDRYDPSLGVPLARYAVPNILGEIRRYFRDKAEVLRYPRRLVELRARRAAVVERLAQDLKRMPSGADIAAALPDAAAEQLDAAAGLAQPDTLDGASHSGGPEEVLAELVEGQEDENLARSEDRTAVRQILARLSPRERIIIHLRFYEGLSQAKTAQRLGISQMHVSRWEHRVLDKLRRVLQS